MTSKVSNKIDIKVNPLLSHLRTFKCSNGFEVHKGTYHQKEPEFVYSENFIKISYHQSDANTEQPAKKPKGHIIKGMLTLDELLRW